MSCVVNVICSYTFGKKPRTAKRHLAGAGAPLGVTGPAKFHVTTPGHKQSHEQVLDEWETLVTCCFDQRDKNGSTWIHGSTYPYNPTSTSSTTAIKKQSWMSFDTVGATHDHRVGPTAPLGAVASMNRWIRCIRAGNRLATDQGSGIKALYDERR
jgi:hypothetical protein